MHDAREIDRGFFVREQLLQRRVLHHNRKGRWGDDIGVARRAGRLGVVVQRGLTQHRASELAHLLATDQVWGGRRIDLALNLYIHHGNSLQSRRYASSAMARVSSPHETSAVATAITTGNQ